MLSHMLSFCHDNYTVKIYADLFVPYDRNLLHRPNQIALYPHMDDNIPSFQIAIETKFNESVNITSFMR